MRVKGMGQPLDRIQDSAPWRPKASGAVSNCCAADGARLGRAASEKAFPTNAAPS